MEKGVGGCLSVNFFIKDSFENTFAIQIRNESEDIKLLAATGNNL